MFNLKNKYQPILNTKIFKNNNLINIQYESFNLNRIMNNSINKLLHAHLVENE